MDSTGAQVNLAVRRALGVACGLVALTACGCRDARSGDVDVDLSAAGQTVEAFGLTLDAAAAPRDVAWAMLMAMRAELLAERGSPEQRAALQQMCDLSHVERLQQAGRSTEEIVNYIRGFAPKIGYYVDAISTDRDTAQAAMTVTPLGAAGDYTSTIVQYAVPAGVHPQDPGSAYAVSIALGLTRQGSGPWRVIEVDYGVSPDLQSNPPSAGP